MYLLDTNTVTYYFKGMGRVAARLLATSPSEIALSMITVYEIEVGIAESTSPEKRRRQFHGFLSTVRLVPFAADEARSSAKIRASLEASGNPIGPLDNLIAGTARAHGATLVTHNEREFRRVRGLDVEDWF